MSVPKYGLFAAGDNSYHQNFSLQRISPKFQFCNELEIPYYQILQIVAWNDNFAILRCDNSIYCINKSAGLVIIHPSIQLVRIQFYNNSILGLDINGNLVKINIETKVEEKIESYQFRTFSSSSNHIIGITTDSKKQSILLSKNDPDPKLIVENAITVGCTDTHIFASTSEDSTLYIYSIESNYLIKMKLKENIVSIFCSEDIALFIAESGNLYQFSSNNSTSAPIRLYGLPPIVEACPGQQHCSAISYDGRLFAWGFNPSCQLGIGSDRSSKDPICVVDSDVFTAACGSHNTWILKKPKKPLIPEFMKIQTDEVNLPKKKQSGVLNSPIRSSVII